MSIYISDLNKSVEICDNYITIKNNLLKEVALKNNILTISHNDYTSKREYLKARKELVVPNELVTKVIESFDNSDKVIYNTITTSTTYNNNFNEVYHLYKNCGYSCIENIYTIIEENFKINDIIKIEVK